MIEHETQYIPIFPTMLTRSRAPASIVNDSLFKKVFDIEWKDHLGKQPANNNGLLSKSNYVLEDFDFLEDLKVWLDVQVINAFDKWGLVNTATPYITQSWFTKTYSGQDIHRHNHPNSLMSGVVYIKANKNSDHLFLSKPYVYQTLNFITQQENEFNSQTVKCTVESGDLIMFPSNLEHWFNHVEHNDIRISLAFNTFIEGYLGDEVRLTHLPLKANSNIESFRSYK